MDAIGIWTYRGTLLDRTVATLVKHCPQQVPIYILDQTAPSMRAEKERIMEIAEAHPTRVSVAECFTAEDRKNAPGSIIRFLNEHPKIERLLKIDDDYVVPCDIYSGVVAAYESHPDTFFSMALCLINNWGLQVFYERLNWDHLVDRRLLDPVGMYDVIRNDPRHAKVLWSLTTPPARVMPKLCREPRFVEVPSFDRALGMSHYFAHRDDIITVGGRADEPHWHKFWHGRYRNRPRVIDTWSLAYHFAWHPWLNYAVSEIKPIIERTEF